MREKFDAQEIYDAITWRTKKRLLANVKSLIDDTGDDGPEIWTEHNEQVKKVALYEAECEEDCYSCATCDSDGHCLPDEYPCPNWKPEYTTEDFK